MTDPLNRVGFYEPCTETMQFIFSLKPEEAGAQSSKAFLIAIQIS